MHYQFMLCLHKIFGDVCPQVEDPVSTAFYRLSWQQDIGGGQEGPHTINLRCHWCARMSNQYVFNFVCELWCKWVATLQCHCQQFLLVNSTMVLRMKSYQYLNIALQEQLFSHKLSQNTVYSKGQGAFHHWRTEHQKQGVIFNSQGDARRFERLIRKAISEISPRRGNVRVYSLTDCLLFSRYQFRCLVLF